MKNALDTCATVNGSTIILHFISLKLLTLICRGNRRKFTFQCNWDILFSFTIVHGNTCGIMVPRLQIANSQKRKPFSPNENSQRSVMPILFFLTFFWTNWIPHDMWYVCELNML